MGGLPAGETEQLRRHSLTHIPVHTPEQSGHYIKKCVYVYWGLYFLSTTTMTITGTGMSKTAILYSYLYIYSLCCGYAGNFTDSCTLTFTFCQVKNGDYLMTGVRYQSLSYLIHNSLCQMC